MTWTPAIRGGEPAFPEGPPSWPGPDPDVLAALERAYRDGSWGRYDGTNFYALVAEMIETLGVTGVFPCSSGTFAVELALRGLGVEAGDEVVLGAYDYPGNFRSIEAIGALPVLIDLDPQTRCLDIQRIAGACGPKTKAVIATHLHGGLVDMWRLRELAAELKIAVVEDACQAPGAILKGAPSGTLGDAGVYSFGGSKLLTAGRGGAVVTNRLDVMQRMRVFSERGNAAFPLSELQAAVLVPQWEKLWAKAKQRCAAVERLTRALADAPELVPVAKLETGSSADYYKLGIMLEAEPRLSGDEAAQLRNAFAAAARAEGIALDPGFRGFLRRGDRRRRIQGDCPTARRVVERTLVLHHPILSADNTAIDLAAETLIRLATAFREGRLVAADIPTTTQFDGRS